MSRSPERISSYRRHFEEGISSSYQVRVSSPSPVRRESRYGSVGYSCRTGTGGVRGESAGRTMSATRRSRIVGAGVGAGALVCVGPTGEPPMDLDVAAAENLEFRNTRNSERQEMIVLNDRLAVYIDKVRSLEQQNKLLEAEIEAYQNRFVKPSGLRQMYEEQLRELKKIAEQMKFQRDIAFAAKDSTAAQLEAMKLKYEEAVELRRKAEAEIEVFRPDVDQATSSRIALEKKLEQLEVEIEFLKRVHQQEIEELLKQIYAAHVSAESAFALPDLAAALKQIQNQYDDIAAKNLQEMDSWYKNKFQDLTKKTSRHVDSVRSYREGIGNAKKDIQNRERDLEALKTKNEALELKIREMQEKYRKELEDLQTRIENLQIELKSTKEKIAMHLRDYQDLLNIKMALELEITTYRKLIEGEDLRLSGMMQTLSLTGCSVSVTGGTAMSFSAGGIGGVGGTGGGGVAGHSSSGGDLGLGLGGAGMGASSGGRVGATGVDKIGAAGRTGAKDLAGSHHGLEGGRIGGSSSGPIGIQRGSGVAGSKGFGDIAGRATDSSVLSGGDGARAGDIRSNGGQGTGGAGVAATSGGASFGSEESGTDFGSHGSTDGSLAVTGPSFEGIGIDGAYTGASIGATERGTSSGGLTAGFGGVDSSLEATGSSFEGSGIGPGSTYRGAGGAGTDLSSGGASSGDAMAGLRREDVSNISGRTGLGSSDSSMGTSFGAGATGLSGTQPGSTGTGLGDAGLVAGESTSFDVSGIREKGVGGATDLGGAGGTVVGDSKVGLEGRSGDAAKDGTESVERSLVSGTPGADSQVKGLVGPGREAAGGGQGSGGFGMGFGSDQYGSNIEPYVEQAVEVTERRTVLIRTIKHENEVLEMDHQEQTFTISGAADDSDIE